MKKIEQLIKELQALTGNSEMNKIIEEKLWDAWRDAHSECDKDWVARTDKQASNLKAHPEVVAQMMKSHKWQTTDVYGNEPEQCYVCEMDDFEFDHNPQFCIPKEAVSSETIKQSSE